MRRTPSRASHSTVWSLSLNLHQLEVQSLPQTEIHFRSRLRHWSTPGSHFEWTFIPWSIITTSTCLQLDSVTRSRYNHPLSATRLLAGNPNAFLRLRRTREMRPCHCSCSQSTWLVDSSKLLRIKVANRRTRQTRVLSLCWWVRIVNPTNSTWIQIKGLF